mmetsp:Transcript_54684/g.85063  ORF Transcript_54684/g.85063 Transcript_54684/m.85063 type:complete len:385 (+) Transcript_54684:54-1208(+)
MQMSSSQRIRAIASHILPQRTSSPSDATAPQSEGHANSDARFASRVGISFLFEDALALPARRRVRVQWHDTVSRVLLVKKWRKASVTEVAVAIARWLATKQVVVFVESEDLADYGNNQNVCALDTSGKRKEAVDLVISLGGDGTLLHASRLFRFLERCISELLPPCLVLGMGSLGFLATVDASQWKPALETTLCGNLHPVPCTLRTRLFCSLECPGDGPAFGWHALNECAVLTRGRAIGKLHVYVDGAFVTRVEGDGIIISSPTGSTGYSLSCGGPIVSPSVPCILMTPIAPASLSFRPILVSEQSRIDIALPIGARTGQATIVVDGRKMGTLRHGGQVVLNLARPIPVLNVAGQDKDWFDAITTKLKWNARDVEQADVDSDSS